MIGATMELSERFWSKVDKSGDCWEWTASTWNGYGRFKVGDNMFSAHRLAYSFVYGPIPDGMYVCHHCDNPCCVKPNHLFLGTNSDNQLDSAAKGRKPDRRGQKHPLSRLVENDVHEIRRLCSLGVKQKLIGKMWKISQQHVSEIVNQIKWGHIGT